MPWRPTSEVASSPARPPVHDSANASVASCARSDSRHGAHERLAVDAVDAGADPLADLGVDLVDRRLRLLGVGAAHDQLDVVDRASRSGSAASRRRCRSASRPAGGRCATRPCRRGARCARPAPARPPRPGGRARRGITSSMKIFSISRGTPGRKYASAPPSRTTKPGAIPAALGSACGPVGDAHLAQVVGRHLEAVGGEPLLHRLQRRLVGVRPGHQQLGHGVDGPVVLGRARARPSRR